MRGSAFHSSSRSRSRLAPLRQSSLSASFSASETMASLAVLDSAAFLARSSLRALRWVASTGDSASSRPASDPRSPTALASTTWARTALIASAASSGDSTPALTRCSRRCTSRASAS